MPFRSDGTYSFVYEESRANRVPSNQRTPKPLSASTKKLFQAIENANLEDFKQAIAKGADVNAFDEGCTPLMTIVTNLSVCPRMETEKKYHSMVRLLLLDQNINVNICEQINDNTVLHLAMCFQQKKTLQLLLSHPNINTNITNKKSQSPSCMVPGCDGMIKYEKKIPSKEELWDKYYMGAPEQQRQFVEQYKIVKRA